MRIFKKSWLIGIVIILLFFITITCTSSDNKLNGKWKTNSTESYFPFSGFLYDFSIELKGNQITLIENPIYFLSNDQMNAQEVGGLLPLKRHRDNNFTMQEYLSTLNYLETIDDRYNYYGDYGLINRYIIETKGTYSINDDKIEIIFPDGNINVFTFSKTENTITIEGFQFNRQK